MKKVARLLAEHPQRDRLVKKAFIRFANPMLFYMARQAVRCAPDLPSLLGLVEKMNRSFPWKLACVVRSSFVMYVVGRAIRLRQRGGGEETLEAVISVLKSELPEVLED